MAPPAKGHKAGPWQSWAFRLGLCPQELVCLLWVPMWPPQSYQAASPGPPHLLNLHPSSHHWQRHSALLVSPYPQFVPTLTPPFKRFVLALNPSVPSSPSFPVMLWEPVAWKQERNTLSWKMGAWYLFHVVLHACPYRPCYKQWARFISCWLGIRNYYSVSLSLYIDMNVGRNHSTYLVQALGTAENPVGKPKNLVV